ncbi:hypothetical protein [Leucobacter luti]|uniref:Uncharacterized protein n=1 Tax=Leucobacter luti TaxID=340320 RepID=A0A4R6S3Y6_9MICO|nr:hypothetical protein [Leucobacter luti]MCW2287151.1 hypothetical protein [Leucobacter luti]QYM76757.1 hypothetical protein K1X41_04975 [Leucobacter luti]TCK41377.1 hypothetical protein EDF60_1803 [Leucobacter luti]TDP94351.1 hypothetical protein EDF62_0766 [Leucobacter luti]
MTNQASGTKAAPPAAPSESQAPQHAPFVPNPHEPASASTVIGFIIAAALVFGGFYMMGMAFSVPGAEFWLFGGGIVVDAVGLWVAFGLIPYFSDRKARD